VIFLFDIYGKEDIKMEPILFSPGKEIDFKKVQDFLINLVKQEKNL